VTSGTQLAQARTLPAPGQRAQITSTLSTTARHTARHAANVVWYHTVAPGETLSGLAARYYGNADLWPALWWVSKAKIPNPNDLPAGLVIKVDPWHPGYAWLTAAAMRAIPPPPPPPRPVQAVSYSALAPSSGQHSYQAPAYSGSSGGSYSGGSSFEQCVISRESGGNAQVMNSSGHYGLYQFSASTWAAYGGSPSDFGHASAAEQHQVFSNAVAQGGQSNWSPYDGC
jgi:hypothetical protein